MPTTPLRPGLRLCPADAGPRLRGSGTAWGLVTVPGRQTRHACRPGRARGDPDPRSNNNLNPGRRGLLSGHGEPLKWSSVPTRDLNLKEQLRNRDLARRSLLVTELCRGGRYVQVPRRPLCSQRPAWPGNGHLLASSWFAQNVLPLLMPGLPLLPFLWSQSLSFTSQLRPKVYSSATVARVTSRGNKHFVSHGFYESRALLPMSAPDGHGCAAEAELVDS